MNTPQWIETIKPAERGVILHIMKEICNHCSSTQEYRSSYLDKVEKYFKQAKYLSLDGWDISVNEETIKLILELSHINKIFVTTLHRLVSHLLLNRFSNGWHYFRRLSETYHWENFSTDINSDDLLDNYTYLTGREEDFDKTNTPISHNVEHLFITRNTRLAILHYMIEVYNYYRDSSKCQGFNYIENVALKFDLNNEIGEANYFPSNFAQSILRKEEDEIISLFKKLIGYLLSKNNWFLKHDARANSLAIESNGSHWINNILGYRMTIFQTSINPLDPAFCIIHCIEDKRAEPISQSAESILSAENISKNESYKIEQKNNETTRKKEKTIEDYVNEIFYKDL